MEDGQASHAWSEFLRVDQSYCAVCPAQARVRCKSITFFQLGAWIRSVGCRGQWHIWHGCTAEMPGRACFVAVLR
eukprot:1386256-Rhodomonas_salina.1